VVSNDGLARRFAWDHRFLFAPIADLRSARDGLQARLARLNPMYVQLDDDEDKGADEASFARLRDRLRDAERKVDTPTATVSPNGPVQLGIVEAPFPSASVAAGERLVEALGGVLSAVRQEAGPAVEVGMTEDVVIAVAEHRAILDGMSLAV